MKSARLATIALAYNLPAVTILCQENPFSNGDRRRTVHPGTVNHQAGKILYLLEQANQIRGELEMLSTQLIMNGMILAQHKTLMPP